MTRIGRVPRRLIGALALLAAGALWGCPRQGAGPSGSGGPGRPGRPGSQGAALPAAEAQLALGNPTNALASPSQPENYLLQRDQYALSWNDEKGTANWVSWRLVEADLGPAERGQFQPDPDLPEGFKKVTPRDYSGSGCDRGHLCPSGDRTVSAEHNKPTFYMTNMVPQAAGNNQGPWKEFEEECRDLARQGNELYIIAGPAGSKKKLKRKVTMPEAVWKVAVVLPATGGDPVARVDARTRVIALWMPNLDSVRERHWRTFQVSVDEVEQRTGLELLSNLPRVLQDQIEGQVDRN
jgi:endonuclease G